MAEARGPVDPVACLDRLQDDLYDGHPAEVVAGVWTLLDHGLTPDAVLTRGLVAGMDAVGADFRAGALYVPQVLLAAKAMKAGMEVLRPLLAETGASPVGTVVIGTVRGDLHDIGKSLVAMLLEGAGFRVVNLGTNTDAERFMAAVREHEPDILGLSAMLTTTLPYMRVVIRALEAAGRRGRTIVLVGGAPLNDAVARDVGADAYCRDAATAVATAKRLLASRAAPPGSI